MCFDLQFGPSAFGVFGGGIVPTIAASKVQPLRI